MQTINKSNKKVLTSALILIMALGAIAAPLLLTANAQEATTIPTQLYMSVAPNPIGVDQTTTAVVWNSLEPPQYIRNAYYGWQFTVNVVKPDGSNETLGPFESSTVGGYYTTYVPKVAGNYTFQAFFPETKITIPSGMTGLIVYPPGDYVFPAAVSSAQVVEVLDDPVEAWPQTPLPTDYWSYPISAENQDWYTIAGNYLRGNPAYYNDRTLAPDSAHILWTKPLTFGGISGGNFSEGGNWGVNYYTGLLYENKFNPIIINGHLYYNQLPSSSGKTGVNCVDLRTGELIWENSSMPMPSVGQVFTLQTGVEGGSIAYLWGSYGGSWQMYDAFTGRLLTNFVNPSGSLSAIHGPNGEILVYQYNANAGWFSMWNSTRAVFGSATQFSAMQYSPQSSYNRQWSVGVQWNVTIPATIGVPTSKILDPINGVLLAESCLDPNATNPLYHHYGYSLQTGEQLWQQNRTDLGWGNGGPGQASLFGWSGAAGNGYYSFYVRETQQYYVYDIKTGKLAWISDPLNKITGTDYAYYDWAVQITNGLLITAGYSGCVVAFNVTTGHLEWVFRQENAGLQTPFGTWPTFGSSGTVADGKIYWPVTQHSPGTPLFRGYRLYCINFTTGTEIWQMPGFFTSLAVSGGELITYAGYDNQIYAFGKGQSETTVSASDSAQPYDTPVLITGSITDQSPGTTAFGPAAGTPAISDEHQGKWMEYLYQQKVKPTDAVGVPVSLIALDSNGNYHSVGETTSDINGQYAVTWTPPVPGLYTINAYFAGTNSYYPSSGQTYLTVAPEPDATSPPQPQAESIADTYFVPAIAAIIVIIIVGFALMFLALRKRP